MSVVGAVAQWILRVAKAALQAVGGSSAVDDLSRERPERIVNSGAQRGARWVPDKRKTEALLVTSQKIRITVSTKKRKAEGVVKTKLVPNERKTVSYQNM